MQSQLSFWIILAIFLFAKCGASNEKNDKVSSDASYSHFGGDIYLDDQDGLEGSGEGGDEVRDDLEASGSGLGPDDEDGDGASEFNNNNTLEPTNKPVEPKISDETIYKTKQKNVETINRPQTDVDLINSVGAEENEENMESEVYIMNPKHDDRATSFFGQPGILAAVIGGAVVGLLCAILVVMFIVYRMRKKDEGSYALDEPRRSPAANAYPKPGSTQHNREFYA